MDIIDSLLDDNKWQDFLAHKLTKSHLSKVEEASLIEFVENKKYVDICKCIVASTYTFSIPKKTIINKSGSNKKRVVYSFLEAENMVLKFVSFCLYKYDNVFSPNTYAFRHNFTVKQAFLDLVRVDGVDSHYSYKIDISNYFNSIDISLLLPKLKHVLSDDIRLYDMLAQILTLNKSMHNDIVIEEARGVMAGTPLSTFLANVYLMDLDWYFYNKGVVYARYSDDIIVFSKNKDSLDIYKNYILDYVTKLNLVVNPDKVSFTSPYEKWDYLGFQYSSGNIDLSSVTLKKIKDKIRRKARSIYRWKEKKCKEALHAAKVLIRVFNNKFYRVENTKTLSWCKWFFPVINTDTSLKIIDDYLLQYIRYMYSGKFKKQNYNITYDTIKKLGYRSLVNEYYKHRKSVFNKDK